MSDDNNTMGALTHILGFLTGFVGPLIVFFVTKDESVKDHAKLALNWQFTAAIYIIISIILSFVLIGMFTLFAVLIMDIIFSIMAAVKAKDGQKWKYPLSISFFKVKV